MSLPVWAATGLYSRVTPVTESPPVNGDELGSQLSVAVSADGQTALVGASNAAVGTASGAGKAYIYHFANGQWTLIKEIDDPDTTTGDRFGISDALNGNGTAALIGSETGSGSPTVGGRAFLYTLSNGASSP